MTVGASFNLPDKLSAKIQEAGVSKKTSDVAAQLITPCAVQVFSVPLHLVGLDLYNSPTKNMPQRREFIGREYTKTVLARWGRIFPAFGAGGVLNTYLKGKSKEWLHARYPHEPAVMPH